MSIHARVPCTPLTGCTESSAGLARVTPRVLCAQVNAQDANAGGREYRGRCLASGSRSHYLVGQIRLRPLVARLTLMRYTGPSAGELAYALGVLRRSTRLQRAAATSLPTYPCFGPANVHGVHSPPGHFSSTSTTPPLYATTGLMSRKYKGLRL